MVVFLLRAGFLCLVLLTAAAAPLVSRAGVLALTVTDESGEPVPCRVLVRPRGGECVVPAGATELAIGPDRWFFSPGRSALAVPNGKALLRIERGLEFRRIKQEVEVAGTTPRTVTLQRWINMKQRGYRCGENHLHVDTETLAPMLVAEGLDFGSSLTWWRGPDQQRPIPPGAGRVRRLEFAGRSVPASVYDAELEYSWGAAYIQYLPEPMPLAADRQRPNLDYLQHAVQAGAIVHYQGGWSREVAVDALLGCVHTINVCNNNFAMHRFQPRSRYSNLLGVEGFPVYPDTDRGMLRMNTDTYYRLLNWGLRLAAGAGSATGVKQAPVGYNRAYVRAGPAPSLGQFNAAWIAGKNFVTNGPVVFLTAAGGQRPGDTIELPASGGSVRVEVEALADQRLVALEVIVNGRVAAAFDAAAEHRIKGTTALAIERGSWIAARCTARDDLLSDEELAAYRHRGDDEPNRIRPSRLRFAHTSPIYVQVAGRAAAERAAVGEGLKMLERFEAFAHERAGPAYQASIQAATDQARHKLQARLVP